MGSKVYSYSYNDVSNDFSWFILKKSLWKKSLFPGKSAAAASQEEVHFLKKNLKKL